MQISVIPFIPWPPRMWWAIIYSRTKRIEIRALAKRYESMHRCSLINYNVLLICWWVQGFGLSISWSELNKSMHAQDFWPIKCIKHQYIYFLYVLQLVYGKAIVLYFAYKHEITKEVTIWFQLWNGRTFYSINLTLCEIFGYAVCLL